jgi:hypothetical protein
MRTAATCGIESGTLKLSQAAPANLIDAWNELGFLIPKRPCIAEVAGAVVDHIYATYEESLVLVRAFLAVPYRVLPEQQQRFATDLARSARLEHLLTPQTPVHSLIATRGKVAAWNNPRESRGHVAIPLLSDDFVSSIPMMSYLHKELGLPLTLIQEPGAGSEKRIIGSDVGIFFVADPANATDDLGRKIIPAQDFVIGHSVRSVFAVGGSVFGGALLAFIFFAKDSIEQRTARAFVPLINEIRGLLISRCSSSRVFPAEKSAVGQG